jgi:DNA-damage-inducible protein D
MIGLAKGAYREVDDIALARYTTNDMKRKLGVPAARPLADFLATLVFKAKDFATELTSHNVVEKDLELKSKITKEHVDNNYSSRYVEGARYKTGAASARRRHGQD